MLRVFFSRFNSIKVPLWMTTMLMMQVMTILKSITYLGIFRRVILIKKALSIHVQTHKVHVFIISKERGATTLIKQDVKDGPETMDNLFPTQANSIAKYMTPAERDPKIKALLSELHVIPPPGFFEIKQCELYQKWRPFLKQENRDITCPRPAQTNLDCIKNKKNEKARARTAEKGKAKKSSDKEPPPNPQLLALKVTSPTY